MFTFFHRTPTIVLDCFVPDSYIFDNVPIVNAHKTYPKWWLDLPVTRRNFDFGAITNPENGSVSDIVQKDNNMKSCYGFLEYYKRGAVIENWCDIRFKVGVAGYKYMCSNGRPPEQHKDHQKGDGFKNYHHAKLVNPWLFRCNESVKFLFSPATWNLQDYDFVMPPGVLNFDLVNIAHVNIFIPKRNNEFEIPIGLPLVHLIPLSDKRLEVKNNLITQQEYEKMSSFVSSSFYGWRRKFDLMFRNKGREDLKCPFHK